MNQLNCDRTSILSCRFTFQLFFLSWKLHTGNLLISRNRASSFDQNLYFTRVVTMTKERARPDGYRHDQIETWVSTSKTKKRSANYSIRWTDRGHLWGWDGWRPVALSTLGTRRYAVLLLLSFYLSLMASSSRRVGAISIGEREMCTNLLLEYLLNQALLQEGYYIVVSIFLGRSRRKVNAAWILWISK